MDFYQALHSCVCGIRWSRPNLQTLFSEIPIGFYPVHVFLAVRKYELFAFIHQRMRLETLMLSLVMSYSCVSIDMCVLAVLSLSYPCAVFHPQRSMINEHMPQLSQLLKL